MSSDEYSIRVNGLSKRYEIYAEPADRLRQMVLPRLRKALHRAPHEYFNEFWALRDVSFDVKRGETVGIVGRNGSGKSTLLQMVCGTLSPTVGSVDVRGRIAALLELGAGFNPEFTGRENVRLSGLLYGLSDEELSERYPEIVDFAEIGDFINQPVKMYSSGMYVRLAFAIAINVSPDILVIDEALAVGDESFQRKCFARIDAIREAGATVLFVSHAAGTVIELCNRAILLDAGELLLQGLPKHIISRYHKLLYAPREATSEIRNRIRQEGERIASMASNGDDRVNQRTEDIAVSTDDSYYEEGLVPKSTLRYEDRGAEIVNPVVVTASDQRVNVLRGNVGYVYTYNVKFRKRALGVRFGMAIRTVSGFALGGAASAANAGDGIDVDAGQEYEVRFRFRALMAPGVYFLNAGVTAAEPDGDVFLDRIIDAIMIRIMPDSQRLATEFVNFDVEPEVVIRTRADV